MATGEPLRVRARLFARALAVGGGLAVFGVVALVLWGESLRFASEKMFALGTLVLGFAILGWSATVFAGRGMENFHDHLGGNSDWSSADARQAMSLLGSAGLGGMVGASLVTMLLTSVV